MPVMPLTSGTKVGPYEILSPLGAGGMGEVYRARDTQLARDVAIKVLPSFLLHDPDRLWRFEQEARAAAALNHPNILAVFQLGSYEGAPYLVSELLEGSTLSRATTSQGVPAAPQAEDFPLLVGQRRRGTAERKLAPRRIRGMDSRPSSASGETYGPAVLDYSRRSR
jgi:hypothetical protein